MRQTYRLRLIREVSFSQNEATNFHEHWKRDLKHGEAVALLAKSGNQIVFVLGQEEFDGKTVLRSLRWRIEAGGTWSPLMLQNYAHAVGIHLEGVPTLEEWREGAVKVWGAA